MAPFDEPSMPWPGPSAPEAAALGARTIWLSTRYGAFYYAHLERFRVGDGAHTSQGDLIAYNGNTGNAPGGARTFISRSTPADEAPVRSTPTTRSPPSASDPTILLLPPPLVHRERSTGQDRGWRPGPPHRIVAVMKLWGANWTSRPCRIQ